MLTTPVAFLIFNRPDLTARVFAAIAAARPRTLLVVADGPRAGRPGEADLVAATRAVVEKVDWPCEVLREYADANLGCRRRVASGLDWVFRTVEEAIILEDDCLPDLTFFPFCREVLARYRDDERVMAVSGNNFQPPAAAAAADSYYFSRYPHIWGWATWRRAWRHYDVDMALWPAVRDGGWTAAVGAGEAAAAFFRERFDRARAGELDTWDYAWTFACWAQSGLSVHPAVNLVTNLGFRGDATHTVVVGEGSEVPVAALPLPLRHPAFVMPDVARDRNTERRFFATPPEPAGAVARLRRLLGRAAARLPSRQLPRPHPRPATTR